MAQKSPDTQFHTSYLWCTRDFWSIISFHKAKKQSTYSKKLHSLTELRAACITAEEWRKLTHQPHGHIPVCTATDELLGSVRYLRHLVILAGLQISTWIFFLVIIPDLLIQFLLQSHLSLGITYLYIC